MNPRPFANRHTIRGQDNEVIALESIDWQGELITGTGMFVNTNAPYLSFSPDGFLLPENDNKEDIHLLEVKCPEKDFHELRWFDENGQLKRNMYYTQIQLGLLLSDLKLGKLVIYNVGKGDSMVIDVSIDYNYCTHLLSCLSAAYFQFYLPILYDLKMLPMTL